jgi:hypothetical protein
VKIEQIRNYKALKFWCLTTKKKVFRAGFKSYILKIKRKRQNGLNVYIFQDNTLNLSLMKLCFQSLNQYKSYRKYNNQILNASIEINRNNQLKITFKILRNLK